MPSLRITATFRNVEQSFEFYIFLKVMSMGKVYEFEQRQRFYSEEEDHCLKIFRFISRTQSEKRGCLCFCCRSRLGLSRFNYRTCNDNTCVFSFFLFTYTERLADLSINQPMLTSCTEGDRHGSGCRIWCETGYELTQTRRGYSRTYLSEKTRTVHNGTLNHEDLDCEPSRMYWF